MYDHTIISLDSYGLGDVIKLLVVPRDRVFTVVGDILTGAVTKQAQK